MGASFHFSKESKIQTLALGMVFCIVKRRSLEENGLTDLSIQEPEIDFHLNGNKKLICINLFGVDSRLWYFTLKFPMVAHSIYLSLAQNSHDFGDLFSFV